MKEPLWAFDGQSASVHNCLRPITLSRTPSFSWHSSPPIFSFRILGIRGRVMIDIEVRIELVSAKSSGRRVWSSAHFPQGHAWRVRFLTLALSALIL
jgi:hypothetical protein